MKNHVVRIIQNIPITVKGVFSGLICSSILVSLLWFIIGIVRVRLGWRVSDWVVTCVCCVFIIISSLFGIGVAKQYVNLRNVSLILAAICFVCMIVLSVYTLFRIFVLHDAYYYPY